MTDFHLQIKADGAAFDHPATEVARILRETADRIERGDTGGTARDYNGNRVGEWWLDK